MKNVKRVGLVSSVLALSLLFAGCGNGSTGQTKESANPDQGGANKPVTLKFLFVNEMTNADLVKKALEDKFYKENPNIKVELEMLPVGEYQKKILVTNATGGSEYDLIFVDNGWTNNLAKSGALTDLTDLAKDTIDLKQYNQSFLQTSYADGKLYALPFDTDTRLMAYNKKMFADAGLQPPKTTDEFLAAAKKLTQNGNYGFVTQLAMPASLPYDLSMMFYGDGGNLIQEDGKAGLTGPLAADYITRSRELMAYMPKDVISYDYNKADAAFASGKIGMAFYGPWIYGNKDINDAVKAGKLDYGLALIPAGKVGSASTIGGWNIGISSHSTHKQEAFKVLQFFSKPDVNGAIVGSLSPILSAYDYPPMNGEKYKVFGEQMKSGRMVYPPGFKLADTIKDPYYNAYAKAVLSATPSPEEAAKNVNDAIQKVLDTNK
jgi:ABC-type glycerol-3-phosphate transport system substrate-binding protein